MFIIIWVKSFSKKNIGEILTYGITKLAKEQQQCKVYLHDACKGFYDSIKMPQEEEFMSLRCFKGEALDKFLFQTEEKFELNKTQKTPV